MSSKKALNVSQIIERAKLALGISTNRELANMLGLTHNAISAWKKRGSADIAALVTLCDNVSADWLIRGRGDMHDRQVPPVKSNMSTKKLLNAKKIIDRAKHALGIKTDSELANMLGLKQSSISSWKKRGSADIAALIALCEGVSTDWLIHGKGDMYGHEKYDQLTQKMLLMLEDMSDDDKRDILKHIEKEKFIKELMREREGERKTA